jgi:hypothetical protein
MHELSNIPAKETVARMFWMSGCSDGLAPKSLRAAFEPLKITATTLDDTLLS